MCEGHDHGHDHGAVRHVHVQKRALAANEEEASHLRSHFREAGTLVVNLISSPGSGKTTLLEVTANRLRETFRLGAIEGDIATERDAERLRKLGIPAKQVLTGGACHLDARQIHEALHETALGSRDVLFIENVGNLVCPTTYDLGEDFKIALLSVTEGDDKPFKYPAIFSRAAVTVITKADLLPHVDFNMQAVRDQIAALNPEGRLVVTSAKTGEGIDAWCELLRDSLAAKRAATAPAS